MKDKRDMYRAFLRNPEEKYHLEAIDIKEKLRLMSKKECERSWFGFLCSGYEPVAGCCENGTAASDSTK
jgi:hypothetical protein